MKKMVINHIDKIFVTSDAATILKELEVQHPAAKMVMMASKMQETECGDATNLVITLAGEFLSQAESLIKMGLHPSQIITGYEAALEKALQVLEGEQQWNFTELRDEAQVFKAIRTSLSSKLAGYISFLFQATPISWPSLWLRLACGVCQSGPKTSTPSTFEW
jgi:T-complex protein 1 subunit theta